MPLFGWKRAKIRTVWQDIPFDRKFSQLFNGTGCPRKRVPKLNGYNFLNFYGRRMKQKLTESWDFKVLFHLSIYFSNNIYLATIQFRMRRLNSLMTRCRISAGINSRISLTRSLIWLIVAGIFSWFNFSNIPKDESLRGSDLGNVGAKWNLNSARSGHVPAYY